MDRYRRLPLALGLVLTALTVIVVAPVYGQPDDGPGERFGSVVEIQGASVEATVDAADLSRRLGEADDGERRRLVAARLDAVEETIDALDRRAEEPGGTAGPSAVASVVTDRERADRRLQALADADLSGDQRDRVEALRERLEAVNAAGRSPVARLEDDAGGLQPLTLDEVADAVGRGLAEAPSGLYGVVGGERVELRLRRADGTTATFHGTIADRRLEATGRGPIEDETLRITATAGTFRQIRRADAPGAVLREAIARGDVRYRGVGTAQRAKYGVIDAARFGATSVKAFLDGATSVGGFLGI